MFKTLENYIEDQSGRDGLAVSFWQRMRGDARYRRLVVFSVVAHLLFYAAIIRLDLVMKFARPQSAPAPAPTVRIIEVPPEGFASERLPPESVERAEDPRFHLDPESTDDVHLTNRSPNPASASTGDARLPSGAAASAGSERGRRPSAPPFNQINPPSIAPIAGGGLPAMGSSPLAAIPHRAHRFPPRPRPSQIPPTTTRGFPQAANSGAPGTSRPRSGLKNARPSSLPTYAVRSSRLMKE